MKAVHLRTEYLENPLGLGITSPRFYWQCEGGVKQTAYQIIAKVGEETVWNSGKMESSSMTHIPYEGRELKSRERVYWSVKLWDENGKGGEISSAWFELGLLQASDWTAKWISGNYKPKKNTRWPVDHFRKAFSALQKPDSILPPAVCMRLISTASGWGISSSPPAVPITANGCSTRPTM